MKNTTEQIQIVKCKKTSEIIGYVLQGESVASSREYIEEKTKNEVPDETPENVVYVWIKRNKQKK